MKLTNAEIFVDGAFVHGSIEFQEKIEKVLPGDGGIGTLPGENLNGAYLIPGLIDIHTHGAMNEDASDGNSAGLRKMSRFYAENGVTSWCPTTMTIPVPEIEKALETVRDFVPENDAKIAGVHMEGPFLSPEKSGAQNPGALRIPDAELWKKLNALSGNRIRLVTVAPELPGAMDFIREVSKTATVSLGHTTADYETAVKAFENGASHLTHTYNCMPGLHHRAPGTVPAAMDKNATAELIADGFHVHPAMVRLTFQCFGENVCLVSDSLRCTGMPEGDYKLGGLDVSMKDGRAVLSGTDTLAGSSVSLMECVRRAVSFGIPLPAAVTAATKTPAKVIGMEKEIGSIAAGKAADLVVLDKDLQIVQVYINGKTIL